MIKIECPHCGASGSITPPPKEFIIIAPCPQCGELVVLFREKVVAINRSILTSGTFEEKRQHIAEVITTFLDSVGPLPPSGFSDIAAIGGFGEGAEIDLAPTDQSGGITEKEVRDFINIDLNLIDKREHFEELFGKIE